VKQSGQGLGELALLLALALVILCVGVVFIASMDENSNGILDSKENYELFQE
jgi:hypothetical protein